MYKNITNYFNDPKPTTAFEKTPELTKVRSLYTWFKNKRDKFKTEGEALGAQSIAYRKYLVLDKLIAEIDKCITTFNKETNGTQHERIVSLVRALELAVHDHGLAYEATLNAQRYLWQDSYNKAIKATAYTAMGAATLFAMPTILGGVVAIWWTAPWAKHLAETGLTIKVKSTETMNQTVVLYDTLIKIGENLGLEKAWDQKVEHEKNSLEIPPPFYCSITGAIMQRPVVCTLDGMTYEREAIIKWLADHHDSPNNRNKMMPNQSIDDVLVRNEPLERLITDFRNAHPELFDKEAMELKTNLHGPDPTQPRATTTAVTDDDILAMERALRM